MACARFSTAREGAFTGKGLCRPRARGQKAPVWLRISSIRLFAIHEPARTGVEAGDQGDSEVLTRIVRSVELPAITAGNFTRG